MEKMKKQNIHLMKIKLRSGATSLFDPPEADKCLLAFGEFNVGRSMFDVKSVRRSSHETSS
jgi:hypothetical protein